MWQGWDSAIGTTAGGIVTAPTVLIQNGIFVVFAAANNDYIYYNWQTSTGWNGWDSAIGSAVGLFTISGQITAGVSALSGVTVNLSGTAASGNSISISAATASNGSYSLLVPSGGTFILAPSLAGYTFSPDTYTFGNVSGNKSENFAASTSALSLTGSVLLSGSGLSGVTMTLSGSASTSTNTNSSGTFSFSAQSGGSYTVTPSRSGYVFSPASNTFNGLTSSQSITFTASTGSVSTIPLPPPPSACADCGLDYAYSESGANPEVVYAPNTQNSLYAYCTNANDQVVACNISLSTTYYEYTNGHFHDSPPPPVSTISPDTGYTGDYANYAMPVTLTTTVVGQIESVYVSDDDDGDVVHTDYGVGYLGLVFIDNSSIFFQIGGSTTNHGDDTWNHYMTVNASSGLQKAADFLYQHL